MEKSSKTRLVIWVPLAVIVVLFGIAYAVEGLGFDPFFWSGTKVIDGTTQVNVSPEEINTWPTFTEAESGISFKYPPLFGDLASLQVPLDRQTTCSEVKSNLMNRQTIPYIFYSPPKDKLPSNSPPMDWMYGTLPGEGDRMALSVDCRGFVKENIASMKMYWWNPEEIELGGRKGYRILFHYDHNCLYEHYVLPTTSGYIVRLSFNACKDSREVVRPYKQAILSTVKFVK
jgi:hypothetical protein